ncbi:bacillithiol biosynthesis cysteine-adding enzyme BshC [Flavicella sp.]|uniref:bacillithiol biosynthesis cysteine-adding enzyme BshC n=1 Tax=Flavicella sp. TaxID=2957742 RepID=UPI00301796BF
MRNTQIPFRNTGFFSKLVCDYIDRKDVIKELYGNFPDLEGFENQLNLKKGQFTQESRSVLFDSLISQYSCTNVLEATSENIKALKSSNTFTVVTGHQLNIFTGPLYFLFKIISTINLVKQLKEKFPKNNFVPVYWMATEDHDFEEINHFFVGNKKISWDVESSGSVGRKSTESIESVYEEFCDALGSSKNANYLKELFKKAYIKHNTLTEATMFLVNELFGEYGLVIIDGDDLNLKKQFSPFVEKELLEQYAHHSISKTNLFLENNYKVQVNPREINLFYIENEIRERIVLENNIYKVKNTSIKFTKTEILDVLNNSPEKFSPNVIMRPLYQESVLPNLCYIGGGGELAYWLQLKELFVASEIVFPVLLLRNSVLLATVKQGKKLKKLELEYQDLFLNQEKLINIIVEKFSELDFSFDNQRQMLQQIFEDLKPLIYQTDVTFKGALEAQEKKQIKGLLNLEKRLLIAEKRKHKDVVGRTRKLQDSLFPRKGLQERNVNFADFYKEYGEELIPVLLKQLNPLSFEYSVIEL